jgi:hypothetical protein
MKSIEEVISKMVNEYNTRICEKYGLDIEELNSLWTEVSGNEVPKKKRASAKKDDKSETSATKKEGGGCPYVFIKGKNEGQTCNSKRKDDSEYCSRHIKCEAVGQKEKKKIPSAKSVAPKSDDKKKKPDEKPKIVIRMNKDINKYWNPETKLVFKSKEERVVIGNYDNDTLNKLTDDDIASCEKYGFKYEKEEEKPKKLVEEKPKPKNAKSLAEEIVKTNMEAKNIENILNEICEDEDEEEEQDEEEDEEEEEEEEILEEDD